MGKKISNTILNNPEERKRRAALIASLNKTDAFRQRASETAKKTSSRPDIIKKRSKVLQGWREENPDKFKETIEKFRDGFDNWIKNNPEEHFEKCIRPMLNSWKSKPEALLFEFCKNILNGFNNHSFIKKPFFTSKTQKRQIDIYHPGNKIIIEFDGPLHFKEIFGAEDFINKQKRDKEVNSLKNEYCVIRVSYEHYNRSKKSFDEDILGQLKRMILSGKPG